MIDDQAGNPRKKLVWQVMGHAFDDLEARAANVAGGVAAARKGGMRTLQEAGIAKVLAGVTTINEVVRVTK